MLARNKMIRREIAVKEQRILSTVKKFVGLQTFLTAFLKFVDTWENWQAKTIIRTKKEGLKWLAYCDQGLK